jgi:hypothetical protein
VLGLIKKSKGSAAQNGGLSRRRFQHLFDDLQGTAMLFENKPSIGFGQLREAVSLMCL